jgi:hypothetical protein
MLIDHIEKEHMQALSEKQPLEVDRYFSGFPFEPQRAGYLEANLGYGRNGRIYLGCYDRPSPTPVLPADSTAAPHARSLLMKESSDAGRTWSEPRPLRDAAGHKIVGYHQSFVRLRSGRLGMVYSGFGLEGSHPGRDYGASAVFRTSEDEGRTWSEPVKIGAGWSMCPTGHALVLSCGRLVAPAYQWISPTTTNDSEESIAPTLSYSFSYVSDDEGRSWKRSLSELFVSVRRAAYDLEEPTVIELSDGRLLMHLRCQLGRMYRCYSADRGMTWSRPEPLDIAASYTPSFLCRVPKTNHLLMVWNQASRQEILTGLQRARLSSAVSKDEGQTWENFKNLESLDDTTVVPPPPREQIEVLEQWEDPGYYQPANLRRYHRAPGVLRICYPNVVFAGDEAVVTYDYGVGTLGENVHGVKLRTIPTAWFSS